MGIVYVFDILALKDGPTRLKYLFYYTLVALETLTMVLVLNLCPPSGGSVCLCYAAHSRSQAPLRMHGMLHTAA